MKKQYLLYLLLIPIVYMIAKVHTNYSTESPFFYGFAENKETELSHDSDVEVLDILVTQGESVDKGQVLMLVDRVELLEKEVDMTYTDENMQLRYSEEINKLKSRLLVIDGEISNYERIQQNKIDAIYQKEKEQKAILEALKSVDVNSDKSPSQRVLLEVDKLQSQLKTFRDLKKSKKHEIDAELNGLYKKQKLTAVKANTKRQRLTADRESLKIVAPAKGVIGNIPTKKGENIKAFSTLLSFYEENPTLVKGYVHESLIVLVNIGDSLTVTSTLRPQNIINGAVIGLGSRIVEIPERLRKLPTIKTYGREVIISIPKENTFLQKEKVSINSDNVIPQERNGFIPNKENKDTRKLSRK